MKALIIAIILSATLSTTAQAATAFWTGNMEYVTTVTYQMGYNCQYNYAGNLFWRVFSSYCPGTVEVY
jgi:hypothetical protein